MTPAEAALDRASSEVFLVFRPRQASNGLAWWHRLIDRHRAHVLAILPLGENQSVALNHGGTSLAVEPMGMGAEAAARGLMWSWQAEALRVPLPALPPPRARLRPPMTCVEAVKALLGLNAWRVLTPRQLRRAAIRMGARPVSPFPSQHRS
jgi:hypothetical protein